MEIILNNIGIINTTNVKLDGLTVITGLNGAGKSTVGKALYAISNSMIETSEKINFSKVKLIDDCVQNIIRSVKKYALDEKELEKYKLTDKNINVGYSLMMFSNGVASDESLKSFVDMFCGNVKKFIYDKIKTEEAEREVIIKLEKIVDIVSKKSDDSKVYVKILENEFKKMFEGQVLSFGHTNGSIIIKDGEYIFANVVLKENKIEEGQLIINQIYSKTIYVDTIMTLKKNFISDKTTALGDDYQTSLNKMLYSQDKTADILGFHDDENSEILDLFDKLIEGKFENLDDELKFVAKSNEPISMVNVASGIKIISLLRRLVEQGLMDMNSLIIIDEPENHLHPEWQVKIAEIIANIAKTINVSILVNTHSPYFLKAIKYYTKKLDYFDKSKFYFAHTLDGNSVIEDVSMDLSKVYESMTKPFSELNKLDWLN